MAKKDCKEDMASVKRTTSMTSFFFRWVEDTLVRHPDFSLPGRKELKKSDMAYEIILVDATETPIERPKKNKKPITLERKKDIPLRASL